MQIDNSTIKDLMGQAVRHVKYGLGKITEINDCLLTVSFEGTVGIKKFRYPDAFEKFLSIDDAKIQSEIANDLEARSQDTDFISHQKEETVYDHLRALDKRRAEAQQIKIEEQKEKIRRRTMMREQRMNNSEHTEHADDTDQTENSDSADNTDFEE